MNKLFTKLILILLLTSVTFGVLGIFPGEVSAEQTAADNVVTNHLIYPWIAQFMTLPTTIAAIFLRMTAWILDQGMVATINISQLVAQTPAINVVWKVVRDFSNIFLIFLLLWSAITLILGIEGPSFKRIVLNIFIAGLLINFSLFFTKLAIDTSNIVAISFYNAISAAGGGVSDPGKGIGGAFTVLTQSSNGFSNSIMQGLRIQTLFDTTARPLIVNVFGGVESRVIIAGVMGIVVMVIAGFSFLAAGVMLLIRLAILVLLMIFSPVFFIGMVFPQVSKYAGQWKEALIGQCIFAPLYMALMYVVLRIILDPGFGAFLGVDNKSTFVADLVAGKSVSTVLQYILVIIMINMGLVAAKSFAGKAGEWGGQFSDWAKKGLSKYTYGIAAQQTIGRFGSDLEKRFADSSLGNTHFGRAIRASTSGALANKNFGGAGSYSDYKKTDKEVKSKERMIQRKRELEVAISSGVSKNVKDALRNMTDSEIAGLDKKFFTDPAYANLVIPHLSSSTYKKVLDGERSEDDKQAISAERKKSFTDFAKTGNHTEISKMLKGMSKEESIEFIEDGIRDRLSSGVGPGDRTLRELVKKINPDNVGDIDKTLITNLDVAEHMNFKQLQGLESSLSDSERRSLGNSIGTRPHAVSYDSIIDPRNMGHWT